MCVNIRNKRGEEVRPVYRKPAPLKMGRDSVKLLLIKIKHVAKMCFANVS